MTQAGSGSKHEDDNEELVEVTMYRLNYWLADCFCSILHYSLHQKLLVLWNAHAKPHNRDGKEGTLSQHLKNSLSQDTQEKIMAQMLWKEEGEQKQRREDPSIGEDIQRGCLICLHSEQPSCFSCLIILGHKFHKIWVTAQTFWSGYEESTEFHLITQYYGVWIWDVKHFSNQAAKGYVWFWEVKTSFQLGSLLQGVKGSSSNSSSNNSRGTVGVEEVATCIRNRRSISRKRSIDGSRGGTGPGHF